MMTSISGLSAIIGNIIYASQAVVALWGAFCVVVVWRRVAQSRFRSEEAQSQFLGQVEDSLASGDVEGAAELCGNDRRAVPQLMYLALTNLDMDSRRLRRFVAERFQRDVLSDMEFRLSWVQTVIKSAPMLGLLGTVIGMMGAFAKLGGGDKVDPSNLAEDISVALLTTAIGLSIAIPLGLCLASINVRIRQLEDLVGQGLTRFFDMLKSMTGAGLS